MESESQVSESHQTGDERNVRHFDSVAVLPYHTTSRCVTLLSKNIPKSRVPQMAVVGGRFDPLQHADFAQAARAEMARKAFLKGGELRWLCTKKKGIGADKHSSQHFFLCIDPEEVEKPSETDREECIEIKRPLSKVRELITNGLLDVSSSLLCMLAMDELRVLGYEKCCGSSLSS